MRCVVLSIGLLACVLTCDGVARDLLLPGSRVPDSLHDFGVADVPTTCAAVCPAGVSGSEMARRLSAAAQPEVHTSGFPALACASRRERVYAAPLRAASRGLAPPQCSDGIDNDGNVLDDYPADPGCSSALDDTEQPPLATPAEKPRLLVALATSGTLNGDVCSGAFTGGDGSAECLGVDVVCNACASVNSCGNSMPDDSRLYQIKSGLSQPVVFLRSDAEFALMRSYQTSHAFACPGADPLGGSGGWQGAPDATCAGSYNTGELLVSFAPDNQQALLAYADSSGTYSGLTQDVELRATGERPLSGILVSATQALAAGRAADAAKTCRPYQIVLLTDGAATCPGDAPAAAATSSSAGIPVWVVGFGPSAAADAAALNAIAAAGGTNVGFYVDDFSSLAEALNQIAGVSIAADKCDVIFASNFEAP